MILTEKNIEDGRINRLVGPPIQVDWLKPKTIGGPGLYLKRFENKTGGVERIRLNSKCNFEKRTGGILLHTNYSNKRALIPIPKSEILELKIIRGREKINSTPLYPMWILLKLGIPILKARYFGLSRHQYSIEKMELKLNTINYRMDFVANGFLFEKQLNFLQGLEIGNNLIVKMKPTSNEGHS